MAGSVDGKTSRDSAISTCASALCRARSSSAGSEPTLCVPKTTSTHGARRTISPRSFCARQPPTAICMPGVGVLDRAEVAEVAVEPVVGVLPDGAGVEDDDVGVAALGRGACSRPARAGRTAARSRARSSGTRTCARGRCADGDLGCAAHDRARVRRGFPAPALSRSYGRPHVRLRYAFVIAPITHRVRWPLGSLR